MRRRTVMVAPANTVESGSQITRGWVRAVSPAGELLVEDETHVSVLCDFLRTSAGPLPAVSEGDEVLYFYEPTRERGCVLGVLQKYMEQEAPDQVTIEARERLHLRCGTSSLTMTKEGAVLVRGVQVVSRASGINKIKGAAVKIN